MKVLNENFEYNTDGWDDGDGITTGEAFIEGGVEYKWVGPKSSEFHLDFDTWQVWEAILAEDEDDNIQSYYFVVDPEDGFIDWGPCDSFEEAKEFLDGKVSDYDEDEDEIDISFLDESNSSEEEVLATDSKGNRLVRASNGFGYTAQNGSGTVIGGIDKSDLDYPDDNDKADTQAINIFYSGKY